jgi:predicted nucleic-acid-binding protein
MSIGDNMMRLYLDNCCFNRPFDDQNNLKIKLETEAKLFIQQKILAGDHELVWSYILEAENNQNTDRDIRKTVADWKMIASVFVTENNDIISFAEVLVQIGMKPKDALHVACAVNSKCEWFFTTDRRLANKQISEIRIMNPLDFIGLGE